MKDKILIVEDNPQNMKLFEIILGVNSYALLKAVDGNEALAIAIRERPDLIIMDIQLPGMSGLEVTRKLREDPSFDRVPIIAVTAFAMTGDREKALEAGCNAYLSKPFKVRELTGMIAEMLLRRQKDEVWHKGDGNGDTGSSNR